jgi:hypothetical protein
VSPSRCKPAFDTKQPHEAEAVAPAAPPAVAGASEVQTPAPAPISEEGEKAKPTKVAEKPKPVMKKVVRVAHRRSFRGAYAQNNGWGWVGGGWGGWGGRSSQATSYRF